MILIDPNETFDYVPRAARALEVPDSERPTLELRALPLLVRAKLLDGAAAINAKTGTADVQAAQQTVQTVRLGLVGWRNIRDRRGNPVEFRTSGSKRNILGQNVDPIADDVLNKMQIEDVEEIADAITRYQVLTVAEGNC